MYNYIAILRNDQNCIFDRCHFNTIAECKSWARGRGGKYLLEVHALNYNGYESYQVRGNKCYLVDSLDFSY